MSIDAHEQMSTGVSDITSIALVTLEVMHNVLLIIELRLWFACWELLGNLAACNPSRMRGNFRIKLKK